MKFIKKLFIKGLNFYSVFSYLFVLILVSILVGVGFCSASEFYLSGFRFYPQTFTIGNNNFNSSSVASYSSLATLTGYSFCLGDKYYQANYNGELYVYKCINSKGTSIDLANDSDCILVRTLSKGANNSEVVKADMKCIDIETPFYVYLHRNTTGSAYTSIGITYDTLSKSILEQNFGNNVCPSCPTCEEQYTSLECQTEYSLIPISSVTENYCTSNFDLISPSDCPISSGTGDTQRSALFLNNVQYAGASNIYVNISDLLDYSTTYIDSGSSFVVDVDGYVADTEYLDNILTVQEYHPNSEDFTTAFVSVMTLGLPYVIVALFVLLIRKLIKKIFKS